MSVEALAYQNQSDAFRLEYGTQVNEQALRTDVESYLGEYRFRIPTYDYSLSYSPTKGLSDIHQDEPMKIKAARAVERRESEWRNSERERAELQGILSLERQLDSANAGDTIVWTSPPGSTDEGYGDYGFIYVGRVEEDENTQEKRLAMTALRVEGPTLDQFNFFLSVADNTHAGFNHDTEFLAHPAVVPHSKETIEELVSKVFDLKSRSLQETAFRQSLNYLSPHIESLISEVKQGAPKQKLQRMFEAIENFSLDLKDNVLYRRPLTEVPPDQLLRLYNYKPKTVKGSCGASNKDKKDLFGKSSNIFNKFASLKEMLSEADEEEDSMFECPSCHEESQPPVGDTCPKCDITIDEAREQGLITCA